MMKLKFPLFLLTAATFLALACQAPKTENTIAVRNTTESNQNIGNAQNSAGGANSAPTPPNKNANVQANVNDAESEKDFTGTAEITEKKNQLQKTAVLKDVRAGQHAGFDRIVFEFEGAGLPSYHIEYIDKPVRACGSGDVVPLKGNAWLEVRFTTAAAHTEEGKPTVADRRQSPNFKIIKELKSTCDFEAEVEWVIGTSAPNRYRVLELKNPTRLTVDIKH